MMHETNAEFGARDEENVGIWAFGLIIIVLGGFAILYYLRYVVPFILFFFPPHFLHIEIRCGQIKIFVSTNI